MTTDGLRRARAAEGTQAEAEAAEADPVAPVATDVISLEDERESRRAAARL
jgi:hypothetical protein